jgi:hypothetical protein
LNNKYIYKSGNNYVIRNNDGSGIAAEQISFFNFEWTVPSGWEITDYNNYSIKAPQGIGDGDITVKIVNPCTGETSSTLSLPVTGVRQDQIITFNSLANKTFGNADFDLTASASSGLPVTYQSSNQSVATISGSTVTLVGSGTTTITASQDGDNSYNAATPVDQVLTVLKSDQTITFNPLADVKLTDDDFSLTASSSSGLTVSYSSSNPSVASVSGTTVSIHSRGQTNITASQSGNSDYNPAASVIRNLTVGKGDQTITFNPLSSKNVNSSDFALNANASSGLTVSFSSSDPTVATISGNTVSIIGAGTTNIIASQGGNIDYNPATDVSRELVVNKTSQVVGLGTIANQTFGGAPFQVQASTTSGLMVSFESSNEQVISFPDPVEDLGGGNFRTFLHTNGAGTADITVVQSGNDTYLPGSATQQVEVFKGNQTITFDPISTKSFGIADFDLGASASSGLSVSYTSSNTSVATVTGATVTIVGVGQSIITAIQPGNSNYNAANTVQQDLTVSKSNQSIDFGTLSDKVFGDGPFDLTATSTSGLTVDYSSSDLSVATVSGNTITIVGAGSTTITASQAGNTNYNVANDVQQSLTVTKAEQAITFGELDDVIVGDIVELSASASSNLSVDYQIIGPASLNGIQLSTTGTGTVTVIASQSGNDDYNAAPEVERSFMVSQAKQSQTINFNSLPDKTYGDNAFTLSATSSSGLTISYNSSNLNVATISGNTVTLVGVGTTTITASQSGNNDYFEADDVLQSLTVQKADQSINFSELADMTVGETINLSATSTSGLDVSYQVSGTATLSGNELKADDVGTVIVTAIQAGNNNYNAATNVERSFNVKAAKQNQIISFGELEEKTFGDDPFDLTATTSSGLAITYSSANTGVATINGKQVTIIGAGTADIRASQPGNENYEAAAEVIRTLSVKKADQTITFTQLNAMEINATIELSATSSSGLEVNYTVSGPATLTGNQLTTIGAGEVSVTASQPGNINYNAATDVTRTFTVSASKREQSITFNTLSEKTYGESSFILDAFTSSGLNVSYTSSDINILSITGNEATILGAGTVQITASQQGNEEFLPASAVTQDLIVNKASQSITIDTISDKETTDAPFEVSATTTSGLEINYVVSGPASIQGTVITLDGTTGEVMVTASQAGNQNYHSASQNVSFNVIEVESKQDQRISFEAFETVVFGIEAFSLDATTSSGLTIVYHSSNTDVATIEGNLITILGAGTTVITAQQSGNDQFNPAPEISQTLEVLKADQSMEVGIIEDKKVDDDPFMINASTDSGIDIEFSILEGPATIDENIITLTGDVGQVTIELSNDGNRNYHPINEELSFMVSEVLGTLNSLDKFEIFPNPIEDYVILKTPVKARVQMFTQAGKRLFETSIHGTEYVDMVDMKAGVYLLTIIDLKGNKQTKRIIKN